MSKLYLPATIFPKPGQFAPLAGPLADRIRMSRMRAAISAQAMGIRYR